MTLLDRTCVIHVARLEHAADASLLSGEEQARAAAFVSLPARRRYVAARVVLRRLCALYTGLAAEEIRFDYGRAGKPRLPGATLEFNVAHCDDLAVVAFAYGQTVGIDLERTRLLPDMDEVAAVFLRAAELALWRQRAGAARERMFFEAWTRNEAYAKLTGDGLASALDSGAAPGCWFYEFEPAAGFVGMLAMEQEPKAVEVREFVW